MNKGKWNSLPDDIKKVFTEVAAEWKEKTGIVMNQVDNEGEEFFVKQGGEMIPLSEKEENRWVKAAEPVFELHIKEMEAKGYKRSECEEWISFIRERTAYWNKKEKRI